MRKLLLILLLIIMISGGIWQPYDPDDIDILNRFASPDFSHLLGTDHLGRDLLSRLLVGGWRTALVMIYVAVIGFGVGTFLGLTAAISRGLIEKIILQVTQLFILLPTLIIALTITAILGLSPITGGIALGIAYIGQQTVITHGLTRKVQAQPYILAAIAMGLPRYLIAKNHILPNILPLLFTHLGNQVGASAVAYASLAFIGLGADPSKPDWGAMLFEYRIFIFDYPLLMIWPGCALALTILILHQFFDKSAHQKGSKQS